MTHPPPPAEHTHPARFLAGRVLGDGWTVLPGTSASTAAAGGHTGGHHSVGYFVQHKDGREGFLKAVDVSGAYSAPDVMEELQRMTSQYLFEVQLLKHCQDMRLSRVVHAIAHGEERLPGVLLPVPYIIFDRADGDLRDHLSATTVDDVWLLQCLHHVTVGVQQLHQARFAHNDLKPANVLVFPEHGWKVGDLGTAVDAQGTSPHHEQAFPGTWEYAPPETLYYARLGDVWLDRKRADLYMLGGLVTFLFTHRHFNMYLYDELAEQLKPLVFAGDFEGAFADVLPHVLEAFERAMAVVAQDIRTRVPAELAGELITCIRELCTPDPLRRGHPRNLGRANPTTVQQYISLFNRLALQARLLRRTA